MAGSKIIKGGQKVSRIRRATANAKNDTNCRQIYFKPENIKWGDSRSMSLARGVLVSTNTTFRMKTRVKVIVEI